MVANVKRETFGTLRCGEKVEAITLDNRAGMEARIITYGASLQAVQAGLEAITEGTTAREPVKSRFGWHILRLHRRIEGRTMTFDMVRDRIADMLEARSWSIEAARYVARLAERNEIEGIRIEGSA